MPYRKRTTNRKRNANNKPLRKIARAEARKVLSREIETKYTDHTAANQSVDASVGKFFELTENIAKGTGAENSYIGTKITPKYLEVRGAVGVGDSFNYVRVFLIQSKTANAPTVTSIFDLSGSLIAPFAFLNRDYTMTYKLLGSKLLKVVDGSENSVRPFFFRVSARKLSQVHTLTGSSARTAGLIWLCAVSDSTAAAHPTMSYMARLSFTDA